MESWFTAIVNYLMTREMHGGEIRMIGVTFTPWSDSLYETTLTCLNIVHTKSLEDASLMSTFIVSSPFAMINLMEDTLLGKRSHEDSSRWTLLAHLI